MKLTMTNGQEAVVGVSHFNHGGRRGTLAWLRIEGFVREEGFALCSKEDNFCKRTGRRLAANRLLAGLRKYTDFTKEDRLNVFRAVCPEYNSALSSRKAS